MSRAADWDASTYHRVAQPHVAWGANVLDRLQLRGDEVVLDAGCGSGRITAQLLERLPQGRVVAADASPAMLAEARGTLQRYGDQVRFVECDLLRIGEAMTEPVDVVFSTATFHWIADHARLFAALHHVLKPGGRLVAQFGGGDNLAEFMRAADAVAALPQYAATFAGKDLWRFYYGTEETHARLEQAGFKDVDAWLEPSPQTFPDRHAFTEFCRTVVLSSHIGVLPEDQRPTFLARVVDEIVKRQGAFTLDYIRLNINATATA